MKPGYLNELSASFYFWLDNRILKEGESFVNHSGSLEGTFDPFFSSYSVYGSRHRQWVSDIDVAGAIIPSGIYSNGVTFLPKAPGQLMVDYSMGRVILDPAFASGLEPLSANFSYKEFNLYPTSKDDVELLFEEPENAPSRRGEESGVLSYSDHPYPAIFVKFERGQDSPFAFGGIDEADWRVRCTILADSAYKLDACLSIFSECAHKSFKYIESKNLPFNVFGDVKSPNFMYSYMQMCESQSGQNWIYINSVEVSKFPEKVNRLIKDDVWGAFADFNLKGLKNT